MLISSTTVVMASPIAGEYKDNRVEIFINDVDERKPLGKIIKCYGTQKWNDGFVYGWGVGFVFGCLLGSFLGPLVLKSLTNA